MATYVTSRIFSERRHQRINIPRRQFRQRSDAFYLSDVEFLKMYRLPKFMVVDLCNTLTDVLAPSSAVKTAMTVELKVLCALNFFATGSYQRAVGNNFNLMVSQSAVSQSITSVSQAIVEKLFNEEVTFPREEEYAYLKCGFMEIANFPGVIGAIDCTHIAIIAPNELDEDYPEEAYINRKGFHSINVQMICDSNLKITNVNPRFPGRSHDSFIWRSSLLRDVLEDENSREVKGWLLGDSGYPLEPWLLTPVLNPSSQSESNYNKAHSRTRNVIERCFGVLKARFRCLNKQRVLCYKPPKASAIINACAVLHNLCIKYNLPEPEADLDEEDSTTNTLAFPVTGSASIMRNNLINNIF